MKEVIKERVKSEIIKGLKDVENLDILIFIKSIVDESNRGNKKEAV